MLLCLAGIASTGCTTIRTYNSLTCEGDNMEQIRCLNQSLKSRSVRITLRDGQVVDAFNKGGCAGCHVVPGIPGANGQIGPDLSNIGTH